MSKIFKPRRGKSTTMTSTDKKNIVLARGEMFIEVPNTGVGTGASRLIMGNGTDTYETLSTNHKYALDGVSGYNTSDVYADSTYTDTNDILNNDVVDGKTIRNLFGNIKKAINKNASDISSINNTFENTPISTVIDGTIPDTIAEHEQDIDTINTALNGLKFGTDSSGKYGYYKVGADTVTPFRNPTGNASQSDVLSGKTFSNILQEDVSGTMTNRGAWIGSGTPSGNNSVDITIPEGYHSGRGYVRANGGTAYNTGYNAGYNAGYEAGRNQGRADETTHTLTLKVEQDGPNARARLLYDNNEVAEADTFSDYSRINLTAYTKYSGIRWGTTNY